MGFRQATTPGVVGDEPWITIDWQQPSTAFAGTDGGGFDRVVATLLVTDIVDSTVRALELGDGRWRDLLARHYLAVRAVPTDFGAARSRRQGRVRGRVRCAERAIHAAQESVGRRLVSTSRSGPRSIPAKRFSGTNS